jgi:CRP/FNR family transcriptional regulator, cyclic AMP receptor protein
MTDISSIYVADGNARSMMTLQQLPSSTARRHPLREPGTAMFTRKHTVHPALLASDLAVTVPVSELEQLDRLATTLSIPAGEEIMHADDFGRECFVVIDGEFRVQLGDTEITVGPGAVIGELSLLTLKPRTASVTASVDSSVYVMNRSEFATVLDTCPRFSRYVLDGAVQRTAAA